MTEDQAWDDPAPLYRPNWRDRKAREAAATDWQGRALAAEAAAEGYQQRAERAEAAQREAVKAFQRERARVGRAEELERKWSEPTFASFLTHAAGDLRAALADGPTDD